MEDVKQVENEQENNEATEVVETPSETKASDFVTRDDLEAILKELEKVNDEKWKYMDSRFDSIITKLAGKKEEPKQEVEEPKKVVNTDLYKLK